MYPPAFNYHAPDSLESALDLLGRLGPEAKLLAGGASLIPLMKLRLAAPAHLVDLGPVPGLDEISFRDGTAQIGAMVRENDLLSSPVAREHAVIADAVRVIADPLVRNVGTIGGNVAHGDPANDQPAVLLALDAVVLLERTGGTRREVPMSQFHLGLFETALEPDEILTAIRVPTKPGGTGSAYVKFERQVGDFAMAAAAAVLTVRDGVVTSARVALTNVGPTPVLAVAAAEALTGAEPTDGAIDAAVAGIADTVEPWADLRASAEVKRSMAVEAARRALRLARDGSGAREAVAA
jgi:aerobic carbon-monoxide dehydrogenase medium subunit